MRVYDEVGCGRCVRYWVFPKFRENPFPESPNLSRGLPFGPNLTYRRTRPRKNKKNIQRHQRLRV